MVLTHVGARPFAPDREATLRTLQEGLKRTQRDAISRLLGSLIHEPTGDSFFFFFCLRRANLIACDAFVGISKVFGDFSWFGMLFGDNGVGNGCVR